MWAVHAVCRAVALSSAGHCDHCFLENREREDRERGAGAGGGGGHFPDCIIMCERDPAPSAQSAAPGPVPAALPPQPAPAAHRLAPAANNFDSDVFSRNFD